MHSVRRLAPHVNAVVGGFGTSGPMTMAATPSNRHRYDPVDSGWATTSGDLGDPMWDEGDLLRDPAQEALPSYPTAQGDVDAQPSHRRSRPLRTLLKLLVTVVALVAVTVVAMNVLSPPTSSMIAVQDGPIIRHEVSIDHVSRYILTAIIMAEDQDFPTRDAGLDWNKQLGLAQEAVKNKSLPDEGGSTIPQQLAKNFYLYTEGPNRLTKVLRKIIEAPIAELTARVVSKKRIMELYANFAQFGPTIFGVCAATWYYFNSPPWDLSPYQASQLAAVLPLPSLAVRVNEPEGGIYLDVAVDGEQYARFHRKIANTSWWSQDSPNSYIKIMEQIGITDQAGDHVAQRTDPNSCSTMPNDVGELLTSNGYR